MAKSEKGMPARDPEIPETPIPPNPEQPKQVGTGYMDDLPAKMVAYFDLPYTTPTQVTTVDRNGMSLVQLVDAPTPMRFIEGFASRVAKVSVSTLRNWAKAHPELQEAWDLARDLQVDLLKTNAMMGRYDSRYATFATKNLCDWRDEHSLKGDGFEIILRHAEKYATDEKAK